MANNRLKVLFGDFRMSINKRKIKKYCVLFAIGAIGYAAIEIIWRGFTHWSMMIAGGLCFVMFSLVADKLKKRHLLLKAAVCAVGVTVIEFIFGVVFNIVLKMNVWDYSNMPLNLFGQICPLFTLLWAVVAIAFLPLADVINQDYA